MVRVSEEALKRLGINLFKAAGSPEKVAEIVTEALVKTSLHGVDSHGARLIPRYIKNIKNGEIIPNATLKVLRETTTTAMLDDGGGFGQVAAKKAMEMAITKAKKHKIGSIGLKGKGHIGALYIYSLMAVNEDMIGIILCRGSRHNVAPYGGVEGRLGVNPLCVSIPAGNENPIVLDMATTGVAFGHLALMEIRNQKVPEGLLIRKDGSWSTNPGSIHKGKANSVCFGYPNSEYKGYGLSVVVEALAGAIGSGCCLEETAFGIQGHVFTAIDPEGYCPIDEFKSRIDSMIRHIKSTKTRPGFKEISLPGDRKWIEEKKRERDGIFIDDPLWENILSVAREFEIEIPPSK